MVALHRWNFDVLAMVALHRWYFDILLCLQWLCTGICSGSGSGYAVLCDILAMPRKAWQLLSWLLPG
eukprot:scaffold234662_cov17-Tisochrysis_lutea.AAC.1